jgi:excisionase family DNA binding protein
LRHINTIAGVAAFVGLSPRTVRRAISAGHLQVMRPSPGRVRVADDAVHAWLKLKTQADEHSHSLTID